MLFAAILFAAVVGGSGRKPTSTSGDEPSCKLILQKDLDSKKEPLLLDVKTTQIKNSLFERVEQLEIVRPEVDGNLGVITVEPHKQLLLACTGNKNDNEGSGKQTAYVSCEGGQLMLEGKPGNKESFSCTHSYAESWAEVTNDPCGSGDDTGVNVQLGYKLDDKSYFKLVDVCHNIERSVTLYSAHALYGHSLKGAVKSSERRKFSRGPKPLFPEVNPDSVYPQKGQEKAFDKILGDNGHALYLNSTCFLARGHFAPDADFIYNSGQLLTYYYVNAAPQWQGFNAGNWLAIENAVRDLAVKEDETLNVFTGAYGVLKLKNVNGDLRMIYLEPTKKLIPAPEVYWKLVQHPLTKSCTVAVGHNNVFLTEPPKPICKPETPDGWPTLYNLAKGYTYYCTYDDFKEVVGYVPNLECKDLFHFPEMSSKTA